MAYGNGVQVLSYHVPTESTQRGKALKITNSTALSTAPKLEAWDDNSHSTTAKEILAGTTGTGNTSFIKAYNSGTEASNTPPSQNWCANNTATAGSANPNALKGTTNYVTANSTPGANGDTTWALACCIPSDASAGETGHTGVLTYEYTYTGSAPTIQWYVNTADSDSTPNWVEVLSSDAIYFTGPDSTGSVQDPVTAPASGYKWSEEMWAADN